MSIEKSYQPSPEEIKKAEEIMMPEQKKQSEIRATDLKLSKEELIKSFSEEGTIVKLKNMPIEYRRDKEIVLAAVKNNGHNLKYASPELQSNKEIVLEAVKDFAYAIDYASPELQKDKDIFEATIKNEYMGEEAIIELIKNLQKDKEKAEKLTYKQKMLERLQIDAIECNFRADTNIDIVKYETSRIGRAIMELMSDEERNIKMSDRKEDDPYGTFYYQIMKIAQDIERYQDIYSAKSALKRLADLIKDFSEILKTA